jgi:hypothetical protein
MEGIRIVHEIVQGAPTKELSLRFLEDKVLPLCNAYDKNNPLPNSGLIMRNLMHQSTVDQRSKDMFTFWCSDGILATVFTKLQSY